MKAPKVSVLCMVYKHEAYLRQCFDGFVMQKTTFPIEILVNDDCSPDGSADVMREYEESYPKLFRCIYQEENQYSKGIMPLCETLFPMAQGEYIAICEGDDYWTDPLKLQKQVDFLEGHEEYSMCCTGFSQTFEGDESEKSPMVFDLDDITVEHLIKGQWIGTLTVVCRRELLVDFKPPFPSLPFVDVPMWFHLALKGKIKYLKDITGNYRRLNESACHFLDKKKEYLFGLDVMRVREYYAMLVDKVEVAQPMFSKDSHYYLEQCYQNQWFDFPIDTLWHFVKEYGHPSGYDKLKYWGMKSKLRYRFSKEVLSIKKK